MTKTATILTVTIILLSACLIYGFYRNIYLREELAAEQRQCQNQIARLQSDYQEELRELQQYLLKTQPASVKTAATAGAVPDDDSDAPEAFKKPALKRYSESMEELVARKYRFLLKDLGGTERQALMQLLVERERLALLLSDIREYSEARTDAAPEELELQLAEIDEQIQALLDSHAYQKYELLKDSDNEQHHFTQFTLGINGIFPLNNGQQEAVLFAKMRYEKAFEARLKDSGLHAGDPLTQLQRDNLHAVAQNAVEQYKRDFLQEIKQYLDAGSFPFDQYTLVENYTNTEFQQMLDEIRKKIDSRAQN
jgi:class 3 adenylate cyclase